jgi:predicted ATPase
MLITRFVLKNWRNFRSIDVPLTELCFVIGPNASGKSNLLDAFRFLRDVSKAKGGGLQTAVAERGGISKLRCLHARRDPEISIQIDFEERDDTSRTWSYLVAFRADPKSSNRVVVAKEQVLRGGNTVLSRPNQEDKRDPVLLTQTFLEQIQTNSAFRVLAEFFAKTTYLHLVPQLLKFSEQIGGQRLEDDPFGQGLLERIAKTSGRVRTSRLLRIERALKLAVPRFEALRFTTDKLGHPHLEARYTHHRPNAGWQSEEHFSDGTLRLLGLLWTLQTDDSLLLIEEPEISLNDEIVRQIPLMLSRVQQGRKSRRQILVSTHSQVLLSNPGIDGRGVILLEPGPEGSTARSVNDAETQALRSGLSVAEVLLPKTRPSAVGQLGLW